MSACFRAIAVAAVLLFFLAPSPAADRGAGVYAVIPVSGTINPIMAQFVSESVKRAAADRREFIVIQLDTPGGDVESMRDIIKAIASSPVPVVVYTWPRGARAASAGGFIMIAAHVAAMSPDTEIGAMHPVGPALDFFQKDPDGSPAGAMEKKVLNDMSAYARSLAQQRGRNAAWVEKAVRSAHSSTAREALMDRVIDLIADDMPDLLAKIDGRRVRTASGETVIRSRDAVARPFEMTWKERIFSAIANPQVVMLLLLAAIAGIGIEFKSPGLILPGVTGVIALFLFLIAMRILPINAAGVALIVLAVALFILEVKFTSYGALTAAGILSFAAGSMILFDSPLPGGRVPLQTVAAATLVTAAFFFFIVRAAVKAQRAPVSTGMEGMIGARGTAAEDFSGTGTVMVRGELWKAEGAGPFKKGDTVTVTASDGLTLVVRRD